ncbi:UDP-N-acetylglucosamine transferase subunit ALG14 homolog [Limulus polyphemus]|uniref:UDP-N-acetylglucosamine transferase subunit ALG14 n=1 Tax=Limulus polyphemus TaxID=6850 RepID=A0ABM1BQ95_LIMPO|nr:UDP-N-acetylglucosamine transferase subunit ALG14 homolog [Limulus polyphemus]
MILYIILFLLFVFFIRTIIILKRVQCNNSNSLVAKIPFVKVMAIIGSGGHTSEIIQLIHSLSYTYYPRIYVIASSDKMSQDKVLELEQKLQVHATQQHCKEHYQEFCIEKIPRSREVHQSWITTVISTIYSILHSVPLLLRHKPDMILCNGPGTCVPVCLVAFFLSVIGMKKSTIVYVESICRVQTLSLSGQILYYFADYFFVQWPQLKARYTRATYLGLLVN